MRLITDKYHENDAFHQWSVFDDMCVMDGPLLILILVCRKSVHVWRTQICAKNDFYIFVLSDRNLWPLGHEFAPLVTLVQRYVFAKLEVSTAFLFQKIGGAGRTTEWRHQQWQCSLRVKLLQHTSVPHKALRVGLSEKFSLDQTHKLQMCPREVNAKQNIQLSPLFLSFSSQNALSFHNASRYLKPRLIYSSVFRQ